MILANIGPIHQPIRRFSMEASSHGSHHEYEQEQQQQERKIAPDNRISKIKKAPIRRSSNSTRHLNHPTINFLLGTTDRTSQTEPEESTSVVVKCNPNLPSSTAIKYHNLCGEELTTHKIELGDRALTLVLDPTQSQPIVVESSRIGQQDGKNNLHNTQSSQKIVPQVAGYDNKKHLLSINNLISPVAESPMSSYKGIVADSTVSTAIVTPSINNSILTRSKVPDSSGDKSILDSRWKFLEPLTDTAAGSSQLNNSVSSHSTTLAPLKNKTPSDMDTLKPILPHNDSESSPDAYRPILEAIKDNTELWKSMQVGKKGLYCCTHCPEKYPTLIEYAQHLDSIQMVRSFRCEYEDCPWHYTGFEKRPHWRRHVKAQHGTRQSCSFPGCTKVFSRKDSLRRHYRNVHLGRLE